MEREIKGRLLVETFGSLKEFYDVAVDTHDPESTTPDTMYDMVTRGWPDQVPMLLDIAESAVQSSVRLHDAIAFTPVWDVSGATVDVARFLSGEPECMIDFPLRQTVTAGRVITLVSSADCNMGSDWLSRGIMATGLGMALHRMGYATEMWTDNYGLSPLADQYQRVMVKSTSDEIDPARLMFAFGHSGMLDPLAFSVFDGWKRLGSAYAKWAKGFSDDGRGSAEKRTPKLEALYPEGTIFLTGKLSCGTSETAKTAIEGELRKLGLIDE
jgi:hypothetical protein